MYAQMAKSEEMQKPLAWTAPGFELAAFDLVLLPGGHEKSVRQIIDSPEVHQHLVSYFPLTKKPGKKAIAAICHGVMVLSESKHPEGSCVIRDCITTTLPTGFEKSIFWLTRPFLGDYYKTYGAKSDDTEQFVRMHAPP